MKTKLFKLALLLTVLTCKLYGQTPETTTTLVGGYYTGKNLIVKNCYSNLEGYSIKTFAIRQVKINGHISTAEINSDIFEIPLDELKPLGLKLGDSITVEIKYLMASSPKTKPSILNPGALLPFQNNINSTENHLTIEGEFSWGALFIINPYNSANKTYCIKDVKINGKIFNVDLNKEIISIDINKLGEPSHFNSEAEEKAAKTKTWLKVGDKIQIEFTYAKGSDPIILNPELITPWSTNNN